MRPVKGDNSSPVSTGPGRQVGMFASLEEVRRERFVPFTFGPLYVCARIPFDTVQRFVAETDNECYVTNFDFEFDIITLPEPYCRRLFVMDDKTYPKYVRWIESVNVVNREEQLYAEPMRAAALILDPFQRMMARTIPAPGVVDVITVSTNKGIVRPRVYVEDLPYPIFREGEAEDLEREEFLARLPKPASAPPKIYLEQVRANPLVQVRAKELLK
jgi:hypothetical protein